MSEGLTALASENLNPSLRSLLEDVQKGHIRVPRFQRPFVWSDSQRLELLRSIRDNMPIGSLLVWRTVRFKLASFSNVGPHVIPPILEKAPATGWQYLLDGHQRVSTLLGLLLPPFGEAAAPKIPDEDFIDWDIQYDLFDQEFVFRIKSERAKHRHPLLPLSTLLDGRLVNKHMREIRRRGEAEGWTDEQMETWEERADQLSYRFQQCRVPIVVMVSDDLELAARTFQRINSLGTPMGEAHLVAALTWRDDFDLRDEIDRLRLTFPPGWRSVEEGLILQVCKGIAGLDITKSGQTELVKILKEESSLLNRAGVALRQVLEWLSTDAGVVHEELLPYALQAVILATAHERNSMVFHGVEFSHWFWRTSWSEVFSTALYREVREEQDAVQRLMDFGIDGEWQRDQVLPERFDFRSARVRLFTLRLSTLKHLCDATGQLADGRQLLKEHGRDALVRLFAIPRGATPELKILMQGPGNRFFIDPNTEKVFRDRLINGPDFTDEALSSHFIEAAALQALRRGDFVEFFQRRRIAMEAWDASQWNFCKQLVL